MAILDVQNESKASPDDLPSLVFSDEKGNIRDIPDLKMAGMSGRTLVLPGHDEITPLPFGSTLFFMPGRSPIGWNPCENTYRQYKSPDNRSKCFAVSAFLPPGYVRTLLPAAILQKSPPALPLWAYTAVGWKNGRFWAAGIMVDPNPHWDPKYFQDDEGLACLVRKALMKKPNNRLLHHLAKCALEYHCFAAKNCFYNRWELPLPTSPSCNAGCLGCLSLQPAQSCPAPHGRIKFVPSVDEICDIAIPHLEGAEDPIASFGQGCEGEPVLQAKTLKKAIEKMRCNTKRGIINLNTNGSKPEEIAGLCQSGLDSVRVTMNSPDQSLFNAYHKPVGFSMVEIKRSLILSKEKGASASINLLVFPGVTDREKERDRMIKFIRETGIEQVQMRNLNIDPDLYLKAVETGGHSEPRYNIRKWMNDLNDTFPDMKFGYFNRGNSSPQSHGGTERKQQFSL
ncbi:radical SAM protein [bacterium]|nr:radical SAM protein [bacterium]